MFWKTTYNVTIYLDIFNKSSKNSNANYSNLNFYDWEAPFSDFYELELSISISIGLKDLPQCVCSHHRARINSPQVVAL